MNSGNQKKEESKNHHYKTTVHHVLAHSYSLYFFLFILGVLLDIIFPIKLFKNTTLISSGFLLMILSSLLILWAQKTSRNLRKVENVKKEHFCRGPYCYTRNPTHWGLFILMLGFGIMANAFFIVFFTLVYMVLAKSIFLKKEELLLVNKYGDPYIEYRKSVKF
jgi:protein-S-isoprenylcysteine O-methyltransferase Ste14